MKQTNLAAFSGDPNFMMSLARGLAVLQLVAAADRPVSLAEVSRRSGLSRAASRRCLYTLCQLGYVVQGERGYRPRHDILTLGPGFISSNSLAVRAQPLLDELRDELGESCSIGVIDDDHVRYIARAETTRIMSINLRVGSRLPLYATSMGRVLLAGLPLAEREAYLERITPHQLTPTTITDPRQLQTVLVKVADQGFAIVDQELEHGLRSASVPIIGKSGMIAALNVGTSAARVPLERLTAEFLPALLHRARLMGGL